jgi:transposase
MELTDKQFGTISSYLPVKRGNVKLSDHEVLNAILYVAEQGCKWRALPERFGNWHTVYTRMNRWSKNGTLDRVFEALQKNGIIKVKVEAMSLDSTSVKVHPDGTGALKKTAVSPLASHGGDGRQRFIWLPQMLGRH